MDDTPGLTEHDKALLFDARERADKRFSKRVREVADMQRSEWRRGWLNAHDEYWDVVREETR